MLELVPGAWCEVLWARPYSILPNKHLTEGDITRAARHRQSANRRRALMASAMMRFAVGRKLGLCPSEVRVVRRCVRCGGAHGKPRVVGEAIHISATHTHDRVAVAVSDCEVGIDVEFIVAGLDLAHVASDILAPGEELCEAEDFWRYWVRKEAVAKVTGEGLARAFHEIQVSDARSAPRLIKYPNVDAQNVALYDFNLGAKYPGALAMISHASVSLTIQKYAASG